MYSEEDLEDGKDKKFGYQQFYYDPVANAQFARTLAGWIPVDFKTGEINLEWK